MDEFPNRAIVNLEPAFSQFGNQPMQGESARTAAFHKPILVFT